MSPLDPNIVLVQSVAEALGALCDEFVFVGGCAAGLLITDPTKPPVRATTDVDIIVEVATRANYYNDLRNELIRAGFTESGNTICRWKVCGIDVDVMPSDPSILGFTNRWYGKALSTAIDVVLPSGRSIRLISAPSFVATKLEAFYGRGRGQYGTSHDIEDIVNVVDGRAELADEIDAAEGDLRDYLEEEIFGLLGDLEFVQTLHWHFPGDAANQARVAEVVLRLRRIAGLL